MGSKIDPHARELSERERVLLDALNDDPRTMLQIVKILKVPNNQAIRNALVDAYTRLEGQGYVRRFFPRGDMPSTWVITFKGKETE